MTEPQWETIDVPRGAYISWGEQPGVQEVVGAVLDYSPSGGTDFQGNPCPQVSVQLRAPTFSVNKQGQRTEHQLGDLVVMNAGLVSLKRAVQAMQMKPGDLIKVSYARKIQVPSGEVKEFDVQIARGAAGTAQPPQQQAPMAPPQQAYAQQPQQWQQPVQPQPVPQPAQSANWGTPPPQQAQPAGAGWGAQPQSQPPF